MPNVTLYHNPRCSKSRQTLELLRNKGIEPHVVEYLKTPLNKSELKTLLSQLNLKASELLRSKESAYAACNLKNASEEACLDALSEHPELMERPIVTANDKAAIGRPPENVLEIL